MARVFKTKELEASAEEVWGKIGDFHGLHNWVNGIPPSEADGNKRRLGAGDNAIVEELVEEGDKSYTYRIIAGPLPLKDYTSTLSVKAAGEGCVVQWESTFEPAGVTEEQAVAIVEGIYDAGLANL